MKTGKFLLAMCLAFTFSLFMNAQMGTGANGNSGGSGSTKIDPEEIADKQLDALDKQVSLDDFQRVELRDILVRNIKQMKNLFESGQSQENMRFAQENSQRDFESQLKEILTPEQYSSYLKSRQEQAMNPDKKNKKRRTPKVENTETKDTDSLR